MLWSHRTCCALDPVLVATSLCQISHPLDGLILLLGLQHFEEPHVQTGSSEHRNLLEHRQNSQHIKCLISHMTRGAEDSSPFFLSTKFDYLSEPGNPSRSAAATRPSSYRRQRQRAALQRRVCTWYLQEIFES